MPVFLAIAVCCAVPVVGAAVLLLTGGKDEPGPKPSRLASLGRILRLKKPEARPPAVKSPRGARR